MKTFKEFNEAMKDNTFRAEFRSFADEKKCIDKEQEIQMVIDFASSKGFEITAEELGEQAANSMKLSAEELESVSAGYVCGLLFASFCCDY